MQTPEVRVHAADNPIEDKQSGLSMSRRYSKRILLLAILGCASIFVFVMFSIARAPGNVGWKGAVQNMHIPGHLHDGVNLEEADDRDTGDNDENPHGEDLLKPDGEREIMDHLIDKFYKDAGKERPVQLKDKSAEIEALAKEFNITTYVDKDTKMKKFRLPEEFIIRNEKGEIIEVKHLPNGLLDLISLKNGSRQIANENSRGLDEGGLEGGPMNPFLDNADGKGDDRWQGGGRHEIGDQQGDFGSKQGGPGNQQGDFGPKQGGPGNQQGDFEVPQGGLDNQQGDFGARQGGHRNQQGDFGGQQGGPGNQQGDFGSKQGGPGNQQGDFGPKQGGPGNQQGDFEVPQGGLGNQQGYFGARQGGHRNQQGDFGGQQGGNGNQQGDFGGQQGGRYNQQGDFGAQHGGPGNQQGNFGGQQGGFGGHQGGFGAQQGGFGAQQGELSAKQNAKDLGLFGKDQNVGQNNLQGGLRNNQKGPMAYKDYLKQKNLQTKSPLNNVQPPVGQHEENKNYPDNGRGDNPNQGFGWKNALPGNANDDIIDNNLANNADIPNNVKEFMKNRNKAAQNKQFDYNILQDSNKLNRPNNLPPDSTNLNPANNIPHGVNPFILGNNLLRNPNKANQGGNRNRQDEARNINNGPEEDKQQSNEENKSELSRKEVLQRHNLYMEDLTAQVSIQAKCVDFRFPTGSAPLCIHSSGSDPQVSGRIEADEDYERDILDQMMFIMSSDKGLGLVDVGAGFGIYSMAAALLLRNVLAVEPLQVNCQLFHKNAVENGVTDKIILLRQALDNETYVGLVEASVSTGGYSEVHISRVSPRTDIDKLSDKSKIVNVTTLNKLVPAAPFKRAIIKMDVNDGMEVRILDASSEFLKYIDVPYILLHWKVRNRVPIIAKIMARLIPLGYRPRLTWDGPEADSTNLHADRSFMVWKKQ